jgi:hypothetical protein
MLGIRHIDSFKHNHHLATAAQHGQRSPVTNALNHGLQHAGAYRKKTKRQHK